MSDSESVHMRCVCGSEVDVPEHPHLSQPPRQRVFQLKCGDCDGLIVVSYNTFKLKPQKPAVPPGTPAPPATPAA